MLLHLPFFLVLSTPSSHKSSSTFGSHHREAVSMNKDGIPKVLLLHIVVLSAVGAIATAVHRHRRRNPSSPHLLLPMRDLRVMPRLILGESGRIEQLERFSHYVARQIGFTDIHECPHLLKLAYDYLRNAKRCDENIYAFFASEPNAESLCVKLIEELDKCVFGYFSFHWTHAPLMVSQILTAESEPKKKLKNLVLEATREQRFERVTKNLKVTRVFSTLWEELKAIGSDVMVPAAHSDRSPILLLMGGGMGAGKSTILKEILKEPFWLGAAANAVMVEADAFKETDVIYRAISSRGHHNDMLQTAELVHQSSIDAASSLLVTALNEGRDVIMDGTLSWEPFVEQMIAMARNIHQRRYRMGDGYKVAEDGTISENYWEPVDEELENESNKRKPYRIELVGVVCDAHVAVARGIRRAIITGRAVRVKSQLKSHQRFADAFYRYCHLVDNAKLYCTNPIGHTKLIAWKDGSNSLLVEPQEIRCLERIKRLNEDANSIFEVYSQEDTNCEADFIWHEMVMSPTRKFAQKELKSIIQKIESCGYL